MRPKFVSVFLFFMATAAASVGAAPWEVVAVFLGANETELNHQKDIDRNIAELLNVRPSGELRLAIVREFPTREVSFIPSATSRRNNVASLFQSSRYAKREEGGELIQQETAPQTILGDSARMKKLLRKVFRDPKAKRVLILYGHGLAFQGLRDMRLGTLRRALEENIPVRGNRKRLDALWFSSCFMANVEAVYELRGVADFVMASEESEFSAGAPFENLSAWDAGPEDVEKSLIEIAQTYVESYSYVKEGSQREAVFRSPATISVVDTEKLHGLVTGVSELVKAMGPLKADVKAAIRRSHKRIDLLMEEKRFVLDLGNWVRYLRGRTDLFPAPPVKTRLNQVLTLLELERAEKLRTNPRVRVYAPESGSLLVYGYENWTLGDQEDEKTLTQIASLNLKPEWFIRGPKRKYWPARSVNKYIDLSPFAPGLNKFHYYFTDKQTSETRLTIVDVITRTGNDFVWFEAENEKNPIRFSGYTQGVGKEAEKYTGLSILDPTQTSLPPDYSFLEFSKQTAWETLMLED